MTEDAPAPDEIVFDPEEKRFLQRILHLDSETALAARCQTLLRDADKYEAYTTIRQMNWLRPQVQTLKAYRLLQQRFSDPFPPTVCELGACVGTDVRQMILDGLPSERIVASDVVAGYWQLGLDFFGDGATLKARTVFCNAATSQDAASPLTAFKEQMDACYSLLVLHVFDQQEAHSFLSRQYALLCPGGVCFGTSCGALSDRAWPVRGKTRWLFSMAGLKALMEQVGFEEVEIEETSLTERMQRGVHAARPGRETEGKDMLVLSFRGVKPEPAWAHC